MAKPIIRKTLSTPIGELVAAATEKGICLLEFKDAGRVEVLSTQLEKLFSANITTGNSPFLITLEQQLKAYFSGSLKNFTVPLDFKGTPFQMKAWEALLNIPYGETRYYQQQAGFISKPTATRAVATANRCNRIGILIPCHRVIAKTGGLAGYAGGLDRKKFLLDLEKKHSS